MIDVVLFCIRSYPNRRLLAQLALGSARGCPPLQKVYWRHLVLQRTRCHPQSAASPAHAPLVLGRRACLARDVMIDVYKAGASAGA